MMCKGSIKILELKSPRSESMAKQGSDLKLPVIKQAAKLSASSLLVEE
jgi:hypothetical protein